VPVAEAVALAQILEAAELAGAVLEQRTLQVIRALQILVVAVEGVVKEIREQGATADQAWSSFLLPAQRFQPQGHPR
jgi:hypothetical protein